MLICDTHADTLWAGSCRPDKTEYDISPEMLTRNPLDTRLQVLALYVCTGGMEQKPTVVEKELAYFRSLIKSGSYRQVRTVEEALPGMANVMLSIEGCEAFGMNLDNVQSYAGLGVRMAALMWNNENGIGHAAVSGIKEGLTDFGKKLVEELHRCKIAVDISHLNERGSFEVMDEAIPPLASHSCAKKLCDHPRNLSDEQLRRLFSVKGFVGVNFYASFLKKDSIADLNTVVDHMAYMCDLGGEDSVGFGSDFDGIDLYPAGLRNSGDIPALLETLEKRGFGDALIRKIAGENFRSYMTRIGD